MNLNYVYVYGPFVCCCFGAVSQPMPLPCADCFFPPIISCLRRCVCVGNCGLILDSSVISNTVICMESVQLVNKQCTLGVVEDHAWSLVFDFTGHKFSCRGSCLHSYQLYSYVFKVELLGPAVSLSTCFLSDVGFVSCVLFFCYQWVQL